MSDGRNQTGQAAACISRRELLKRGTVVGGTVLWMTPAMQVLGITSAVAEETSPGGPPPDGFGNLEGQVVDASTGDPISGALVQAQGTLITDTTDASGNFLLENIPAGLQTIEASATGYLTATTDVVIVDGVTGNVVIALSAVSTSQITAVLTWGAVPSDLDLHASGPDVDGGVGARFHAFWNDTTPVDYVELDIDDVTSFGPETMAFKIRPEVGGTFVAGTYRVWVHDYTNRNGTPVWSASGASVKFNGLSGQIAEYLVSTAVTNNGGTTDADDDLWRVFQFDLSTTGVVSNIVVFQDFVTGNSNTTDV